jgi:two-component system CheB/CheR fusion protein
MAEPTEMPPESVNDASPPDPAATDEAGTNGRDGARKRRDPNEASAVIGIGASAGGIAALQQFFSDMAPDTGLAFVVVMHLSPEFESQLANVLQQKTKMPVTQVSEPVKVQPNHVYVIPPNHHLTFEDSMLHLAPPQQQLGKRITIDLFFRTLAQAYGQRAVCVIMSGTDSDGVIGLKHIRAQGGLTIAQDPNEAQFDSMPASAISTGMVDWVLPVANMPAKLLEFVRSENRMKLPPEIPEADEPDAKATDAPGGETVSEETRAPEDEEAIGKILADVRAQTGHDFSHYKRATVLRRIARRLQVNSLETLPQYLEFIRTHPAEGRALLQDLLIGVTHFFRDRDSFAALEAHIPQLFAGKKPDDEVRVWVAGCATGEEAYSIAILLLEHCNRLENPPKVQIFATDVDEESIADARDAIYPLTIEADVSPERLREFFFKDHGRYRVRKEIREKVLFAAHNLLKDPPFSRCDLVSCRNLLIYLNSPAQHAIFDTFHFALRPGGLLFLGGAENQSEAQALFSPLDQKHRLFVRRSIPRATWKVPNIPMRPTSAVLRTTVPLRSRSLPPLTHDIADRTSTGGAVANLAGQIRRDALFGELHLRLLEEYGPPSVVVNELHEIVHLSGSAGRYLQFIAGEPTANITKVVHPGLAIELRTALFKATQEKTTVRGAPTTVDIGEKSEVVTLEVRPMRANDQAEGFFLILFERERDAEPLVPPATHDAIVRSADEEIQFLKEQLSNTIEQYEATNEELKAANEELQAMNEEMRSATEELETSKEELQSVNEELTTVNYELKANVEELSKTNADLTNLMASTDIGTVFLDRELRIHRFTPSAQKIFNLIPADLGRPISDITSRLHYEGFLQDLDHVLQNLHTIEREVLVGDGEKEWYLTRIAPYRTTDDHIAGVVATFINITARKKVEEELRDSETKFRTLSDTAPALIWFNDAQGNNQYVNRGYLEFTGKTAQEISGQRWHLIVHPDDREAVVSAYETARLEQKPYHTVVRVRRHDGEWRWIESFAQPLFDIAGHYLGHVGVSPDVTDRRQAEEALRASEERLRTVADHVPQLIWTNDAEGKANYFNRRFLNYTGLSYEQLCGPGWQAVMHPDDAAASVDRWQRALSKGEVFEAEYRLRRRDGTYRWFIGRNVPLKDDRGRVTSWFGSATDIDDLKRAQSDRRETEERFRLLVEGAEDYAMFLLDLDNRITYWSSGAERIFGWAAKEAEGQPGHLIFTDEDRAKGEVEKEIGTAMKTGRAPDRRWHLRKDGSRLWVDGMMTRLDDENGQPRGLAKITRDATEQKEADEALRHARDQLEQRVLERTADLMATNNELERTMKQREQLERELLEISERERRRIGQDLHDVVCQELTATALFLKSAGNNIAQEEAAKKLYEAADIVNRNVGIARDLARGFQLAVLAAGGLPAALRSLCKEAKARRGMTCDVKLPRSIRIRDENIALNLFRIAQEAMRNAVSHSEGDEITICVERERDLIRLVVQDNGKGFRPRKRGKGLGLHIMEYRANILGGTLNIVSGPKGGTRVVCEVPVKK